MIYLTVYVLCNCDKLHSYLCEQDASCEVATLLLSAETLESTGLLYSNGPLFAVSQQVLNNITNIQLCIPRCLVAQNKQYRGSSSNWVLKPCGYLIRQPECLGKSVERIRPGHCRLAFLEFAMVTSNAKRTLGKCAAHVTDTLNIECWKQNRSTRRWAARAPCCNGFGPSLIFHPFTQTVWACSSSLQQRYHCDNHQMVRDGNFERCQC
jgi:hypothetical protein